MQAHLKSSIHLVSSCDPRPSAASIAALDPPRTAWSLDTTPLVRGCSARSARKPVTAGVKLPMLTRMSARCFAKVQVFVPAPHLAILSQRNGFLPHIGATM